MDSVEELDVILVGDTLGMVTLGYDSTVPVTADDMVHHTAAVSRGVERAFVVADVPFLSAAKSLDHGVEVAKRLMQEGGAQAIKIEGGERNQELIDHLTDHDVPVVGHLGLTPQSVDDLGGYKLQAQNADEIKELARDATLLEEAGIMALVLECIPAEVGAVISNRTDVPTIGIGAGNECDGQVLVWQDMMGLSENTPSFVQQYEQLDDQLRESIQEYCRDVRSRSFPDEEHSFSLGEDVTVENVEDWVDQNQ
jgi:3-methyl-2-oxobutanoate hydroxymethyltransferase